MANADSPNLLNRFAGAAACLICVVGIGGLGFWYLTGMQHSILDCVYMSVITITTVGFGEVIDLSDYPSARIFTIGLCLSGIGMATYLLSSVTAFVVEGDLSETFRRRAMEKMAQRLSDHYIVCGIGKVGYHITQELCATKRQCVIIDPDLESLKTVASSLKGVIYFDADATDNDTLLAAGIKTARGLFAVAEDDNQNLVIGLTARQLNPDVTVVASCRDLKNTEKMKAAGANAVISPSLIGGMRMASEMIRPTVVSFLDTMLRDTEKNLRIEEIAVPDSGRTITDLNLRNFPETLLLAVRTKSGWIFNPPRDQKLEADNRIVIMTTPKEREALERHFKDSGE